jgi:hypothetical protein
VFWSAFTGIGRDFEVSDSAVLPDEACRLTLLLVIYSTLNTLCLLSVYINCAIFEITVTFSFRKNK